MEIYLHSDTHGLEDNGIDFKVAAKFMKDLHEAENVGENTIIHFQSIGGEWADGMSIYDAITHSPSSITIVGHGCLCSMGTVILQAAQRRFLMPHCDLMVHFGDLTLSGTQLAMESTNRYYVKVKDAMIDIYARRCIKGKFFKEKGYSLSKVKTYIKRKLESSVDWYMSPEEAVDLGFADKIITKKEYFDVRETKRGNSRGTK